MLRIIFFFILPMTIWGSTWLAIKFQLGETAPELSVLIRFILASLVMFLWALLSKPSKIRGFSAREHLLFAAQGAANYSLNYILTYHAERYLSSGIAAVCFSLMIYFNMIGLATIYKKPITKQVAWGALTGGLGIFLIFSKEFLGLALDQNVLLGLVLAIVATAFASAGNLISVKLHTQKISILSMNFWGMFYGAICTLIICLILKVPLAVSTKSSFWYSMIYLSIGGTVIAFAAYMTLIKEIGADRAAYTTIFTPIIALILSSFFEGYTWSFINILGVSLAFIGQLIILSRRNNSKTSEQT